MHRLVLLLAFNCLLSKAVCSQQVPVSVEVKEPAPIVLQAEKTDEQLLITGGQAAMDKVLEILYSETQATNRHLEILITSQSELLKQQEANQAQAAENCRKKGFWERIRGGV